MFVPTQSGKMDSKLHKLMTSYSEFVCMCSASGAVAVFSVLSFQ